MALKAVIWDRKSPINGVPAEKILADQFYANMYKIMIVQDDETLRCTEIQDIAQIKMSYKLSGYTDEQVVAYYQENVIDAPAPEPVPEVVMPTQTELDLMDGQALLFEQTSQILEAVTTASQAK